jgi:hypothetical protein
MRFQDKPAEEAFTKIAALLATAYQRYSAVRRVRSDPAKDPPPNGLDKSANSSLHEQ